MSARRAASGATAPGTPGGRAARDHANARDGTRTRAATGATMRDSAGEHTAERDGGPARAGAGGSTGRRRLSAAQRRDHLLDAARDIVAADGFAAVTIERVARAGAVARGLVYQQFGDLAGLTTALLDRESAIALAGIGTVAELDPEATDDIGRGILAYLHAAPVSWRIILSPPEGGPPDLRERLAMGRAYARRIAARHLTRHASDPIDPDGTTVRVLLTAVEELARLHLADPDRHPDDQVLRYLRGLVDWAVATERGAAR